MSNDQSSLIKLDEFNPVGPPSTDSLNYMIPLLGYEAPNGQLKSPQD